MSIRLTDECPNGCEAGRSRLHSTSEWETVRGLAEPRARVLNLRVLLECSACLARYPLRAGAMNEPGDLGKPDLANMARVVAWFGAWADWCGVFPEAPAAFLARVVLSGGIARWCFVQVLANEVGVAKPAHIPRLTGLK